jgi:zinc-finger of transposase IS204/IS1001/IS1096/IS1165
LRRLTVYYRVMSQTLHGLQPLITHVLPPSCVMCLTAVTVEPEDVRLQLTTTAPKASCPGCAVPSSSIHSRYQRHLTDLPCGMHPVHIQLTVRKFVCRNPSCPRRIFTERVPDLVAAYRARPSGCSPRCRRSAWPSAGRRAPGSRIFSDCPRVGIRCCGWCAVYRQRSSRHYVPLGSMIGPIASASTMGRSWWTSNVSGR